MIDRILEKIILWEKLYIKIMNKYLIRIILLYKLDFIKMLRELDKKIRCFDWLNIINYII